MSDNGLIVREHNPSLATGTFLGADIEGTCTAIGSGSWLSVALMGVADAVDLAATVSDPFGSLLSAGFGFALDHFQPLKGWLDDLTGDPQAVEAFAGTWKNVAARMSETSEEMTSRAASDLATASGDAITAYLEHAKAMSEAMEAIAKAGEATEQGLDKAAEIVDLVHGIVRDVIAQICGAVVSWAAELIFSFGLATPLVIEQVTTRVSSAVEKVTTKVKGLVESCHALESLLKTLDTKIGELRSALDEIHPGAARGAHERGVAAPKPEHPSTGSTPGKHAAPTPSVADRAKDLAKDKAKELPRGAAEDGVTESSTYDSKQAAHAHDYLQNRLGPLVDSPI